MHHSEKLVDLLFELKKKVDSKDLKLVIQETIERMNKERDSSKTTIEQLNKVIESLIVTSTTTSPVPTNPLPLRSTLQRIVSRRSAGRSSVGRRIYSSSRGISGRT